MTEPTNIPKYLQNQWLLLSGAVYGLLMRIIFTAAPFSWMPAFGTSPSVLASGPMMASFALLVPAIIGAVSYYYTDTDKKTFGRSLYAGYLPIMFFISGTAILLIEGSICIAMAFPLFLIMSSVGGALMWVFLRFKQPSHININSLLLLPVLMVPIESQIKLPTNNQAVSESIMVQASPDKVWQLINHVDNIRPEEMQDGFAYRIGVPLPLDANVVNVQEVKVRKLHWDKNVAFEEPITDWQVNRFIKWTCHFAPDSFPKDALDERVVIGGKYFDLIDTSYQLTPIGGNTRLDIMVHYRISTNFNWYANPLGKLLISDSAKQILSFYKHRAETPAGNNSQT
ncbi:MAG: SRPBCC family protein [Bdellovibrio sp.]|nr:SRPBCC family protein [Methylotenera sp.]